jgi:hypothetical protein
MSNATASFEETLLDEIRQTPQEYLPNLLQIVRLYRESVTLKSAESSFKKGMEEALDGNTRLISDLWEGIDAE